MKNRGECPSVTLTFLIGIPRTYREIRNENITLSVSTTLYAKFRIFGRQREFGFALFPSYPSKAGRPHHLLRVGVKIGQVESSVALAKRGFISCGSSCI